MTDPLTPLPPGPFQLILADPPWAFRTYTGGTRTPTQKNFSLSGSGSHAGAGAGDHYPTMPLDGLKSLDVAGVAAPNALLAMWVVSAAHAALPARSVYAIHVKAHKLGLKCVRIYAAPKTKLHGADLEVKSFQNGGRVANLRLATSESWKDKTTGEKKERTEWHSVAVLSDGLVGVVERWGASDMMERAFSAFEALPPPSGAVKVSCWDVLGIQPGAKADADAAYRRRAKTAHPDQGGTRAEWDALIAAHKEAIGDLPHPHKGAI